MSCCFAGSVTPARTAVAGAPKDAIERQSDASLLSGTGMAVKGEAAIVGWGCGTTVELKSDASTHSNVGSKSALAVILSIMIQSFDRHELTSRCPPRHSFAAPTA